MSTTITTTTTALAAIAQTLADDAQAGRTLTKQRILNTIARGIAGPKHDWGYLIGHQGPVVQKGIHTGTKARPSVAPLALDTTTPALVITPTYHPLYSAEMHRYLDTQITGTLLAIAEDFSTAGEHTTDVQCMFDPAAIYPTPTALGAHSLWGGTPEHIEHTARAYFAASSSAEVNQLVHDRILEWSDDAMAETYKAFYFPGAVVITTEYPFQTLADLGYDAQDDAQDQDAAINGAIQVVIDSTLTPAQQDQTRARVADFLNRLAVFLVPATPSDQALDFHIRLA